MSEFLFSDMSDEVDIIKGLHLFKVANGNGEQQFIVLTAVEGTGGDVHLHLLSHDGRLIVDGQFLLEDATAAATLLADMHELGGEAIADIHHGSGTDASLAQLLNDVATGFCLQLSLQQILLATEVGLGKS